MTWTKIRPYKLLIILALTASPILIAAQTAESPSAAPELNVIINPGKYQDYYHMRYRLNSHNFILKKPLAPEALANGQFELYLDKSIFPIPSPQCKKQLILRMPASLAADKN